MQDEDQSLARLYYYSFKLCASNDSKYIPCQTLLHIRRTKNLQNKFHHWWTLKSTNYSKSSIKDGNDIQPNVHKKIIGPQYPTTSDLRRTSTPWSTSYSQKFNSKIFQHPRGLRGKLDVFPRQKQEQTHIRQIIKKKTTITSTVDRWNYTTLENMSIHLWEFKR